MSHVIGGQSATTFQVAARPPIGGLVMSPPVWCPCGAHCFDQSEELLCRHPAVPYLATRIRGAKREPFGATLSIKGQHDVMNLILTWIGVRTLQPWVASAELWCSVVRGAGDKLCNGRRLKRKGIKTQICMTSTPPLQLTPWYLGTIHWPCWAVIWNWYAICHNI